MNIEYEYQKRADIAKNVLNEFYNEFKHNPNTNMIAIMVNGDTDVVSYENFIGISIPNNDYIEMINIDSLTEIVKMIGIKKSLNVIIISPHYKTQKYKLIPRINKEYFNGMWVSSSTIIIRNESGNGTGKHKS